MLVYLTNIKKMPAWDKTDTTLEEIFKFGSEQEHDDIQNLESFALYRDEEKTIRHNVYHPIDYVSHDVRIVVGEFDTVEHLHECHPDNTRCVKEIDTIECKDEWFGVSVMRVKFPILKHKDFFHDEYADSLFKKLSNDERILFCYVTTSGKGIRFGFKLDARINNDLEYISNYYFYGKEFLKYDTENRFELDTTCINTGSFYELTNTCSIYWFLPTTKKYNVKESTELKKI